MLIIIHQSSTCPKHSFTDNVPPPVYFLRFNARKGRRYSCFAEGFLFCMTQYSDVLENIKLRAKSNQVRCGACSHIILLTVLRLPRTLLTRTVADDGGPHPTWCLHWIDIANLFRRCYSEACLFWPD